MCDRNAKSEHILIKIRALLLNVSVKELPIDKILFDSGVSNTVLITAVTYPEVTLC